MEVALQQSRMSEEEKGIRRLCSQMVLGGIKGAIRGLLAEEGAEMAGQVVMARKGEMRALQQRIKRYRKKWGKGASSRVRYRNCKVKLQGMQRILNREEATLRQLRQRYSEGVDNMQFLMRENPFFAYMGWGDKQRKAALEYVREMVAEKMEPKELDEDILENLQEAAQLAAAGDNGA